MVALHYVPLAIPATWLWAITLLSLVSLIALPAVTKTWQRAVVAIVIVIVGISVTYPQLVSGMAIYWPWDWWPYCFCLQLLGL